MARSEGLPSNSNIREVDLLTIRQSIAVSGSGVNHKSFRIRRSLWHEVCFYGSAIFSMTVRVFDRGIDRIEAMTWPHEPATGGCSPTYPGPGDDYLNLQVVRYEVWNA